MNNEKLADAILKEAEKHRALERAERKRGLAWEAWADALDALHALEAASPRPEKAGGVE